MAKTKAAQAPRICSWPACDEDISDRGPRSVRCVRHQRAYEREQQRSKRDVNGDATQWRDAVGSQSTRMDSADLLQLPVSALGPSRSRAQGGRRKRFDDAGLDELAASIRSVGIVEPLIVRNDGVNGYQIVAGERRWLAAKRAGLDTVPCIVRTWSDEEAAVAQLVENLQRQELHALDEATGFAALVDIDGWDADRVAKELGRSRSHVYGRLRLTKLAPRCHDALADGTISATVARALSSVPAGMQEGALDRLLDERRWNDGEPISSRRALELVDSLFRRRIDAKLSDVGFDPADEDLLAVWDGGMAARRSCKSCEWNTTANRALGGAKGLCCQPDCHAGKQRQTAEATAARARKRGVAVIEAKHRSDFAGDRRGEPSPKHYVRADSWEGQTAEREAKARGEKLRPALFHVVDEDRARLQGERLIRVYERKDLPKAKRRKHDDPWRKEQQARQRRVAAARKRVEALLEDGELLSRQPGALLRLVTSQLRRRAWSSATNRIEQRWPGARGETPIGHLCPDDAALFRFAFDLAASAAHDAEAPEDLESFADALGLDLAAG